MQNPTENMDLSQSILSLIFLIVIGIASFLVVRPFLLVFAWSSIIVIITWPIMLKIQKLFGGIRLVSIIVVMTTLLLLFIIPIFFLINGLINTSMPLVHWFSSNIIEFPELIWLQDIPIIGKKIFISYQTLLEGDGSELLHEIKPYMERTTEFFLLQIKHFGLFFFYLLLMLFFNIVLYWNGEKITTYVHDLANKISKKNGNIIIDLSIQSIRAVALGVLLTAVIQAILSGIGLFIVGVPYWTLVMILIIFSCLLQLGPLFILIPSIIWLYCNHDSTWGTFLLIWSGLLCILDNIIRPLLICMGADLPILLIIFGVIGGLLTFGAIGLFIGPTVLIISYHLLISWIYDISIPSFSKNKIISKSIEKK